jgi:hydroxymethylpyrimidine/phosphomethylpyrimidine kinase
MKNKSTYNALSIAGFDGSGGAGIQADLKTFSALGCYGTTVLTVLPVQNTMGVRSIYEISLECIEEQLKAILEDIPIDAVKIGMLYRADIIESIVNLIFYYNIKNIVLDPVMVAKSGDLLLLPDAIEAMKELLIPLSTVLTPNLMETSVILGKTISKKSQMELAAQDLYQMGAKAVIVKGGHLQGECDDCLCLDGSIYWFTQARVNTKNTHGTGCTFSAAIASYLARGCSIFEAVKYAKSYLTRAIEAAAKLEIGQGHGPVHHFFHAWETLPGVVEAH